MITKPCSLDSIAMQYFEVLPGQHYMDPEAALSDHHCLMIAKQRRMCLHQNDYENPTKSAIKHDTEGLSMVAQSRKDVCSGMLPWLFVTMLALHLYVKCWNGNHRYELTKLHANSVSIPLVRIALNFWLYGASDRASLFHKGVIFAILLVMVLLVVCAEYCIWPPRSRAKYFKLTLDSRITLRASVVMLHAYVFSSSMIRSRAPVIWSRLRKLSKVSFIEADVTSMLST